MAGRWTDDGIELDIGAPVSQRSRRNPTDGLRWNMTGLYEQVLVGLRKLSERYPQVLSLGIDTWAVDYGLLDSDGALLAEPIAYRDGRTEAVIERRPRPGRP